MTVHPSWWQSSLTPRDKEAGGTEALKSEIMHCRSQDQKQANLAPGRPGQGPEVLSLAQPKVGKGGGSHFSNSLAEGQPCGPGHLQLCCGPQPQGRGHLSFLSRFPASSCHCPPPCPESLASRATLPRSLPAQLSSPSSCWAPPARGGFPAVPYPPSSVARQGSSQGCPSRIGRQTPLGDPRAGGS